MCLYLFPPRPKKHRYSAASFEDPRPRKRRRTYQRIPSSSASEASSSARYEPLRGRGLKHDRAVPVVPVSTILRGNGVKRDPPIATLHGGGVKRSPSRRSSERHALREPAKRLPRPKEQRIRQDNTPSVSYGYPQYLPPRYVARGNPLRVVQPPEMRQHGPSADDYFTYLDTISTVRAATNQALQATIYETTRPSRSVSTRRDLRRRPAYHCLQR